MDPGRQGGGEDPHQVLGLEPEAGWDEVRRARRRLAKALHPDRHDEGGRAEAERRMAAVNRAYDQLASERVRDRAAGPGAAGGGPAAGEADGADGDASFAVEALPAEAFEAVLLAAVELGDVIRAEEPDLLAVLVDHPGPCLCVLELLPDAGATTVVLAVEPRHFGACPPAADVRHALVAEIARQAGAG